MISGQSKPPTVKAEDTASKNKKRKLFLLLALLPLCILTAIGIFLVLQHFNIGGNHDDTIPPKKIVQDDKNDVTPSNGNISNMSFVATDGESIYYSSFDQNGLIKVNNDLSGAVNLTEERASFIYPYGDSVICVTGDDSESQKEKFIRINKNDSGRETLAEAESEIACMYLDGESIFYSLADPGTGLYMCDIASKQVTPLSDENISMINVTEDLIYCKYIDSDNGKASIMSLTKDGQDVKLDLISGDKEIAIFEVYGEHIYYSDSNADLYRIPIDGGESALLISSGFISGFNIINDRIHLLTLTKAKGKTEIDTTAWRTSVSSFDLTGGDETPIAKDLMPGSPINIFGGKIYGFEAVKDADADNLSENQQLFRMDTSGKAKEII